jgi:long-chain fatty acid transport protein
MPPLSSKPSTSPRPALPLLLCALTTLLALGPLAPSADAGNILSSQHGGRATAQVGAFTARASDASAVTYNPAATARLDGLQALGGLDFSNSTDEYAVDGGTTFAANHTIQFPPAIYVTYQLGDTPWVAGLGLDTPAWYSVDFDPALFSERFATRVVQRRYWQLHPTIAYQINDNWSVGGGLRYIYGDLELGQNFRSTARDPSTNSQFPFELEFLADETVDGLSFDAGVHYATTVWGFGAVYREGFAETVTSPYDKTVRDIPSPTQEQFIPALFDQIQVRQTAQLPTQLIGGVWLAPYPELRLELDVELALWDRTTDIVFRDDTTGTFPGQEQFEIRVRDWDDTVSVRLAAEGDLSERWTLGGGIAWEPSPTSDSVNGAVDPGFPRGDALVYGLGASYVLPTVTFDVGYSFWDYDDRRSAGFAAPGTYSAREQVWSASARWSF